MSVDPLADQFAAYSPYLYTLGNPLKYTDPTGMAPMFVQGGPGDPPLGAIIGGTIKAGFLIL